MRAQRPGARAAVEDKARSIVRDHLHARGVAAEHVRGRAWSRNRPTSSPKAQIHVIPPRLRGTTYLMYFSSMVSRYAANWLMYSRSCEPFFSIEAFPIAPPSSVSMGKP